MTDMPANVAKRLKRRGDCLVWTGARNSKGYGSIGVGNKKTALVHRYVYEQVVGPIPDAMTIDHLCMNKLCLNVEHLEVVTRAENSVRAAAARQVERAKRAGWTGGPTVRDTSRIYADTFEKYFGDAMRALENA